MKYLKATLLGSGALASLLLSSVLTSCQDEDYGYTTQQIRDSVYARNFEKMYGKIAEDQTWDFSSYYYYNLGLSSEGSEGTRSGNSTYHTTYYDNDNSNGWIDIEPSLVKWMNDFMAEKEDHSSQVMDFHMTSDDVFYLLPIYQGQSSMMWDLYVEDSNNHSQKIWGKSDHLRYQTDYTMWEEYFYTTAGDQIFIDKQDDIYTYSQLKFAKPFENLDKSSNIIKTFFVVPSEEGKTNAETFLRGRFFFTYDGVYIPVTDQDFSDFFNDNDTKVNVENASTGMFSFCRTGNAKVSNGILNYENGAGNVVNLKPLLDKTYNYQKDGETKTATVTDLSKLAFIIERDWTDANNYYYEGDRKVGARSFYAFAGDRVRVFVKHNYKSNAWTNLRTQSDINPGETNSEAYFDSHTISKNHVQTKLIKIDAKQLSGQFKFNLKTTFVNIYDNANGLADNGDNHYSNEGAMNVIKYFSDSNDIFNSPSAFAQNTTIKKNIQNKINQIIRSNDLSDNYKYWILGCEDASLQNGDKDFNDVVFLLIGNKLPKLSFKNIIEKRYMIEDLGSTYDFDFNDIVVDVTEEVTSLEDDDHVCLKQTAKIVSLCGTIPFLVTIGDVHIGDGNFMNGRRVSNGGNSYSSYNTQSSETAYEKTLVDAHFNDGNYESHRIWNPSTNNIKVYVYPNINTDGATTVYYNDLSTSGSQNNVNGNNVQENVQEVQLVEFPKKGKFPYIIATDQNVNWMNEEVSIPASWLKTKPEGWEDWNTHGDQIYNPAGNLHEMWVLWEDTPVYLGDNFQHSVDISKNAFNGAKKGDIITVHVENQNTGYTIGAKTWDYKDIIQGQDSNKYGQKGDYKLTIDDALLSAISNGGLRFNGRYNTITKVTLTHQK